MAVYLIFIIMGFVLYRSGTYDVNGSFVVMISATIFYGLISNVFKKKTTEKSKTMFNQRFE